MHFFLSRNLFPLSLETKSDQHSTLDVSRNTGHKEIHVNNIDPQTNTALKTVWLHREPQNKLSEQHVAMSHHKYSQGATEIIKVERENQRKKFSKF